VFLFAASLIVAGVALFVAAPLGIGLIGERRRSPNELQLIQKEHDRGLAVQGLRELEFDREMGKLSDADYESMRARLEDRALAAMTSIDKLRAEIRKPALAPAPRRIATPSRRTENSQTLNLPHEPARMGPRKVRFCPQCGTRAANDANFCAECGASFKATPRATSWTVE
jgi:hypothetical protein